MKNKNNNRPMIISAARAGKYSRPKPHRTAPQGRILGVSLCNLGLFLLTSRHFLVSLHQVNNIQKLMSTKTIKRFAIAALAATALSLPASAQNYCHSRYYNESTGRLEYSYGRHDSGLGTGNMYYGFRIGPAFSTVNSDDPTLDGSDSQTGLTVGAVVGIPLSADIPLYLEPGLFYTEKGGKKDIINDMGEKKKMTYDLNYIEMPIVLKYIYSITDHFSVQPQFGGYLACGVGGKMKNYDERKAFSSFSDDAFQRFDGGLRVGCGVAYDLFYFDITYDIGLSNICHDTFDTSHNGCLSLNFGVNF